MKIYISGPMTGLPDLNRPAFAAAAARLRARGWAVANPAELNPPDAEYADAMRADIRALLECDKVYLLRGSESSRGAALECDIAEVLGMEIVRESVEFPAPDSRPPTPQPEVAHGR